LQTKCAQIKLKNKKTCAQNRYKIQGVKVSAQWRGLIIHVHHFKDNFVQNPPIPTAHFQDLTPESDPFARAGHISSTLCLLLPEIFFWKHLGGL
jgi:hypothetical protein